MKNSACLETTPISSAAKRYHGLSRGVALGCQGRTRACVSPFDVPPEKRTNGDMSTKASSATKNSSAIAALKRRAAALA